MSAWIAFLVIINAFSAGLSLSMAVWNYAERDYRRMRGNIAWVFVGLSLAVLLAVTA